MSLTDADKQQEVVVSYLPLSHIAAQMIDIWLPMKAGGVTYFAQPDALKVSVQITYCLLLLFQTSAKMLPAFITFFTFI